MRGRFLSVVIAVAMAFLAVPLAQAADEDEAQAIKDFKSIRILVWCVDQKTGESVGFSDTRLMPGNAITIEPILGFRFEFTAGQIKQETITDFTREWKRSAIPLTVAHGGGSSAGSQYLTEPDLYIEYDKNQPVGAVILTVAAGSMRSPTLSKLLDKKLSGDTEELEDLLIAIAKDEQLRAQSLMDVYMVIRNAQRLSQWVAMSMDENGKGSYLALIAAARLGEPESAKRFCEKCLQSDGNAQVRLADLLSDMPPNERFLETMLQLMVLPDPLLIKLPQGVRSSGIDRRSSLSLPIAHNYSKELVHVCGERVVQSAAPQDRARVEQRMGEVLKQIDQLRSPSPTTRSDAAERLRLRREGEAAKQPARTQ